MRLSRRNSRRKKVAGGRKVPLSSSFPQGWVPYSPTTCTAGNTEASRGTVIQSSPKWSVDRHESLVKCRMTWPSSSVMTSPAIKPAAVDPKLKGDALKLAKKEHDD